jgi:hypothetical protein
VLLDSSVLGNSSPAKGSTGISLPSSPLPAEQAEVPAPAGTAREADAAWRKLMAGVEGMGLVQLPLTDDQIEDALDDMF